MTGRRQGAKLYLTECRITAMPDHTRELLGYIGLTVPELERRLLDMREVPAEFLTDTSPYDGQPIEFEAELAGTATWTKSPPPRNLTRRAALLIGRVLRREAAPGEVALKPVFKVTMWTPL